MNRVCVVALALLGVPGGSLPCLRAADVYVSPVGSDANPGTARQPFATLERARDAVRGQPGSTVWLQGGSYRLAASFELTAADSGQPGAPIIYRSVGGQAVRLRGGRPVPAAAFRPVTDPAVRARVDPAAQDQLLWLDLAALGVQHRGPYPNVFTDTGGLVDLYYRGRRMPLARFPNDGTMTMQRVRDNGGKPGGLPGPGTGGVFEYRAEFAAEHARWAAVLARGVWLKGYWRVPWQTEATRVQAIDLASHTVTLRQAVHNGIGSKYHRPAGSGREPYWLLNLLEAVDRPGEWCVDFEDGRLYFFPPAPPADGEVALADNAAPLVRLVGASHIGLRELCLEEGLGHGIEIVDGGENLVAGCTVRNVARYAVVVAGGRGHDVRSCDLYWLGAGGVWLGGGDENGSPRVPAGHQVVNNHIHHFAEIERVYAPGVNVGFTGGGNGGHHPAVGMRVAHNLVHDTPHVGVLHGSWDSVFEYNEIHAYCQVSNDMGGLYCFDRYPQMGNQTIRYNYLHGSPEGDGIYFDFDHREMRVHGNLVVLDSAGRFGTAFLYKVGSQAQGNPQTIECTNNLAIHCRYGFQFVAAGRSRIENNVAVRCAQPFRWTAVVGTATQPTDERLGSGKNVAYDEDPGFVDFAGRDFRLRPDARVFRDLPGFEPIPVDKIGLFVDDYRRRLPTDEEAGRKR